ncbi:MAG: sulfatase [Deltaproteobacteria bacterium]|nr:sulfatase [Deltaproteobacteria bacterium]
MPRLTRRETLGVLGLGIPGSVLSCKNDLPDRDSGLDQCPVDAGKTWRDTGFRHGDCDPTADGGSSDSGRRPDANVDAAPSDGSAQDAAKLDGSGVRDTGTCDAHVADASHPDAGLRDASAPDALALDADPVDTGPPCDESVDASSPAPQGTARCRNLLFIVVDDLNDWVRALGGHPQARTPNLDRLAAMGVTFANAHTPSPECNSARTAMFTGLRPSTTRVYDNRTELRTVAPNVVTMFEAFRAAGYRVIAGGKIFHFQDPGSFESYFSRGSDPTPPTATRPVNGIAGSVDFDWGPLDVPDSRMGDASLAAWAEAELLAPQSRPFVLAAGFIKPHIPFYVPRPYFDLFPINSITLPDTIPNDLDDVPPSGVTLAGPGGDHASVVAAGQWAAAVQGYLAAIAFVDAMIGRLLDALEAGPNANDTTIVLTTDHGWHLGEKQHWRKFALWEEATRVPLIFAGPPWRAGGSLTPGVSQRPVSTLDLYPTLVEWMGLPPRPELEGRSIVPLLEDPSAPFEGAAVTTWRLGNHAVRTERHRYIRYSSGQEELYDHSVDPNEWTNLANSDSTLALRRQLRAYVPQDVPFCAP